MGGVARPRTKWLAVAGLSLWLAAAGCATDRVLDHTPDQDTPAAETALPAELSQPNAGASRPFGAGATAPALPAGAHGAAGAESRPPSPAPAKTQQVGFQEKPPPTAATPWRRPAPDYLPARVAQAAGAAEIKPSRSREAWRPEHLVMLAGAPLNSFPGSIPWAVLHLGSQEILPSPRKVDEPLTLHLDDVDVRKALELLSRETGMNILVSPGVTGRVTVNLKDVSPEQALDAILRLANLVVRREQGFLYVHTPDELDRAFGPDQRLGLRIYRLNYLRSADLEKMVRPFLSLKGKLTSTPPSQTGITSGAQSPGGAAPGGAALAIGGAAAASGTPGGGGAAAGGDTSTGGDALAGGEVVIIQDQEAVLQQLDPIIAQLDVQPLQVLIEAVLLSVTLDKGKEFGVNFAILDGSQQTAAVFGNGALLNAALTFKPPTVLDTNGKLQPGFAHDEHGLKFGFVNSKGVSGFIRAIETIGKVEVLATPRLLVLNKQRAEFQLGDRLGYSTFSQSLVSTVQQVQFLNTGTQLRVRPFISSDGMVRMEIHPERSTGRIDERGIPQESTSEVTTNVMVPDGATVVIGGLIENTNDREQQGFPYLSGLPGIGALFRARQQTINKKELVVLLTPRIWDPSVQPRVPCAAPRPVAAPVYPAVLDVRPAAESIRPGQTIDYDIHLANPGPKPLEAVAVTALFTPGLQPLVADSLSGQYVDEHRTILPVLDHLDPEAHVVYHVRALAVRPGPQHILVQLHSLSLPDAQQVEQATTVLRAPAALGPPIPASAVVQPDPVWSKAQPDTLPTLPR